MAVVQISKIQVRRGKKNVGIGIPQLSAAEFAWAVDSQELYIGNGSIAEGAPYVGNTKIITEHDNILELASAYRFALPEPSIGLSVDRSLQSKLDEYVSILDFGAVPDGSTDNVLAFETAFSELFRNADSKFKKVLIIPNGTYLFTSTLRIPSTAIIKGETPDGAVLEIGANNIVFITSSGLEIGDFNSSNRPHDVEISNLTISRSSGRLVLSGVRDSKISRVKFRGEYTLLSSVLSPTSRDSAVSWQNDINEIKTTDIVFEHCSFSNQEMAIKCTQTDIFETKIRFTDCDFMVNNISVYIDGAAGQTNKWLFENCRWELIHQQAIYATNGIGTYVVDCDFTDCGNGNNSAQYPEVPIIEFGDSRGNDVVNCTSNRNQYSGLTVSTTTVGYPEAQGSSKTTLTNSQYSDIFLSDSFRPFVAFPATHRFIYVNYFLKLSSHSRIGRLTLTIDDDLSTVAITDEYQYSPSLITSPGGSLMTNFEFTAQLKDNDLDSGIDTVLISYKNPLATGSIGTISYQIAYGV
jgi:hypothetical protein